MKRIARVVLLIALLSVSACTAKQEETVQEETIQEELEEEKDATEVVGENKFDITVFNGEWIYQEEDFIIILKIDAPNVENGTGLKAKISESDDPNFAAMIVFPKEEVGMKEDQFLYFSQPDENGSLLSTFNNETNQWESILMVRNDLNDYVVTEESQNTVTPSGKGHWEERTVLVREAWDEQVVVKEGWTEQILVKEGWTETYEECMEYKQDATPVYVCRANGQRYYDSTQCAHECESSYYEDYEYGETYCSQYETRTVSHPAQYDSIYHEPEYKTVHHEAEYKTERVWIED